MKIHGLLALGALTLLSLGSGCASNDVIDPVIEIPEKRVLVVVPFRDPEFDNGWDSPRGADLAMRVTKLLREKAEFKVRAPEFVYQMYGEDGTNLRGLTAKEVAAKCKADYVLMGDVIRWRLADENTYGVKRGSSVIDITLYETADAAAERLADSKDKDELPQNGRGRLALSKRRVTASYPQEYGMQNIGSYDKTDEEIEAGLVNTSAVQVAWLFIPHTKDEEKLAAGK